MALVGAQGQALTPGQDGSSLNEYERTMEGCRGPIVNYEDLQDHLRVNFQVNDEADQAGRPKFSDCVWGHSGIGKTSIVKRFSNEKITWRGKEYPGYVVKDVPIAQFEEMGDLHGIPMDCVFMFREDEGTSRIEQWVPQKDETIKAFREDGWKVDPDIRPRTLMAPPDWVPLEPGPSILLLDDWNRASLRIIKGIMQLLQNYGMVSWKLPAGCNIVLTGNPDEQDYFVTSIDQAIVTRIRHITLQEDAKEWAVWATAQELDPRGINWVLTNPESMLGKEMTNPRTLSQFFHVLKKYPDVMAAQDAVQRHAHSLLDPETVASIIVFMTRDVEDIIEPEDVLDGKQGVMKRIKDLMDRKEPRTDILGITCERLYAFMI